MTYRVTRDGKVAVLVSPGIGAGWSTWSHAHREFLLFDPGLVELAEKKADAAQVTEYLESKGIRDVYMGGWEDVEVHWLATGTRFCVEEYEGSESIRTSDSLEFTS